MKYLITCVAFLLIQSARAQQEPADSINKIEKNYVSVEEEASYPGGAAAWVAYLQKNLKANVPVKNDAPVGKYVALVLFIVDTDGSVSNVKALTRFGYGIEEEVIRTIEASGKWKPAMQNGKPLKAYRKQPITFVVDTDLFKIKTVREFTLIANVNNEISVSVPRMKPADIGIQVPGGRVTNNGDGKFIVKLTKTGRVNITVINTKKDDREIGIASFDVVEK